MAKHKEHSESEHEGGDERWLLTYADMITLLVCIFILLYSMSIMDLKKFNKVAVSIRSGFSGEWSGSGPHPYERKGQPGQERDTQPVIIGPSPFSSSSQGNRDAVTGLKRQRAIEAYVSDQFARLELTRTFPPILDVNENEGNRLVVILSDRLVFEENATELTADHRSKLAAMGESLRPTGLRILVEGYSRSGAQEARQDSWNVGFQRARAVGHFLVSESKINPRRVSLTSYGEWKIPDRSRQLLLNASGQWEQLPSDPKADNIMDRVVVSVLMD